MMGCPPFCGCQSRVKQEDHAHLLSIAPARAACYRCEQGSVPSTPFIVRAATSCKGGTKLGRGFPEGEGLPRLQLSHRFIPGVLYRL